jgi:hypothetical protein
MPRAIVVNGPNASNALRSKVLMRSLNPNRSGTILMSSGPNEKLCIIIPNKTVQSIKLKIMVK